MTHRIALVGTSLGLCSIGAALQGRPELEVLRFPGSLAECLAWAESVKADALIFDVIVDRDCPVIGSIRRSGLVLIGFDLLCHEMVVVSGENARFSTVEDLLQVLARREFGQDVRGAEGDDLASPVQLPVSA